MHADRYTICAVTRFFVLTTCAKLYPCQDERLEWAVRHYGERNWKQIATYIPTRTHVQCLQRWKKALDPRLVKASDMMSVRACKQSKLTLSFVARVNGQTQRIGYCATL